MTSLKDIDPKYIKDGVLNMKALEADGWTYQDFPQMLSHYWDYVLKSFGEQNVTWIKLSEADYGNNYKRGQLMLSRQARESSGAYMKTHPIPE